MDITDLPHIGFTASLAIEGLDALQQADHLLIAMHPRMVLADSDLFIGYK